MADLYKTVEQILEAAGTFTAIELNNKKLEVMCSYVGHNDRKWTAKVKIKGKNAYYTKTGESNSHKEEAVKRALLNAYAALPPKQTTDIIES